MAFKDAIALMTDYRDARAQSHVNSVAQTWFSESDSSNDSMDDVLSVFDSDAENAAWSSLVAGKADYLKLQAVRMQIAFLAGCRRDLRNQYSVAEDNDPKTPLDFIRHARNEVLAANYQTAVINRVVELKAKGAKS